MPRPNPGRPHLLAALLIALACTTTSGERESWAADWNARADAAESLLQNPCSRTVFVPWSKSFLAECERPSRAREKACERREAWVRERSRQCKRWHEWVRLDRNRADRQDSFPEPEVRVVP